MKTFKITFYFVNGESQSILFKDHEKMAVTAKVIQNGKWFATTSKIINLDNVLSVAVEEVEVKEPNDGMSLEEIKEWL